VAVVPGVLDSIVYQNQKQSPQRRSVPADTELPFREPLFVLNGLSFGEKPGCFRFGLVLLFSVPILVLVASAGGYWLSTKAVAPVGEIARAAQSISEHELSKRLPILNTGDELQSLSETLNEMFARLERAFKRVTQFTADASHELRTPIALMRTRTEVALRKQRSEAEYRETLLRIHQELERTSALIENLMTLARADSGSEPLQVAPTNLNELLLEISLRAGHDLTPS
jgi:signal transduction histidine kinase